MHNQKGAAPLLLIAIVGLITFIGVTNFFDFRSQLFSDLFPKPASYAASNYVRGLNLFGGWQGQYGGVDTFASPDVLDYYHSKGLNHFRVGFSWISLQPSLNGPLDPTYLAKMDKLVADAKARGQKIAFVPLPGHYNGDDVNTNAVPLAAFTDLWTKLATHYKDESAIWAYDLINEPNMGDSWNTVIAPAAIQAIRQVDMTHPIMVPTSTGGYGHYFNSHLAGLPMQDPANNLIYEAHFYFDTPPNGQYTQSYDYYARQAVNNGEPHPIPNEAEYANIGAYRAKDFVDWCKAQGVRCFAGEYGVPGGWVAGNQHCTWGNANYDPRWMTVLDNFLTYLDQNGIDGAVWAGGPYGDINDVGPTCQDANLNSIPGPDRPQIAILTKHLGSAGTPTPTPADTPLPTVTPTATPTAPSTPSPSPVVGTVIKIDDSNSAMKYSRRNWNQCTRCGDELYNRSNSWSAATGATMTYNFTGTQLKFYGVKDVHHGIGAISIDNGIEYPLDFYSPNRLGDQLMWFSPVLKNGSHTVKLRVTGTKASQASGVTVAVDRIDVVRPK